MWYLKFCLISYSLSDRKPVESEDEIVVMVVPDYQMLGYVERIASDLSNEPVPFWSPQSFIRSDGLYMHISVYYHDSHDQKSRHYCDDDSHLLLNVYQMIEFLYKVHCMHSCIISYFNNPTVSLEKFLFSVNSNMKLIFIFSLHHCLLVISS